jgi:DNA (cytosine-5)-methyltransferase 1
MRYLSVCSGIEAATVAWHPLGWKPTGFAEIEKFPSKVLAHHYPHVPNLGDMTNFKEWQIGSIDLLVGGTPCQSFSVAGLRKGLDDPRGNLMLTFLAIAKRFSPRWLVWENVPGVLSSNGGRDFGSFLGGLAHCGYGFGYRVLDAQYFGVAQRRRRVFVVGCLGDWRRAAAVLFERNSLSGNPAPSREKRKVTPTLSSSGTGVSRVGFNCEDEWFIETPVSHTSCFTPSSIGGYSEGVGTLRANGGDLGGGSETLIAKCLTAKGQRYDAETETLVPIALAENTIGRMPHNGGNGDGFTEGGPMYTLNATGVHGVVQPIVLMDQGGSVMNVMQDGTVGTLRRETKGHEPSIVQDMAVRRLTPVECERLQGFPDNYTNIPNAADGPRYKALGNSMAVPVMHWIGKRIQMVEGIC